MIRLKSSFTAGQLFPAPVACEIAGRVVSAIEFRVEDVGALEREFARLHPHPYIGMEDDLASRATLKAPDPEWFEANARLAEAQRSWPPTLGSDMFRRVLTTGPGAVTFLAVLLLRNNPGLTGEEIGRMAGAMTAAEWDALDRVAWGRAEWEAVDPDTGEAEPGRGIRWGECLNWLAEKRGGIDPQRVGRMFLTQFLCLISEGEAQTVALPDAPPVSPSRPAPGPSAA